MVDWTNAHYADGPTTAAWFEAHLKGIEDNLDRRVLDWEKGQDVQIEVLDQWLTSFGYHLSELPDECFRRDPIISALEAGEPIKAIARKVGKAPSTIRKYRKKMVAA